MAKILTLCWLEWNWTQIFKTKSRVWILWMKGKKNVVRRADPIKDSQLDFPTKINHQLNWWILHTNIIINWLSKKKSSWPKCSNTKVTYLLMVFYKYINLTLLLQVSRHQYSFVFHFLTFRYILLFSYDLQVWFSNSSEIHFNSESYLNMCVVVRTPQLYHPSRYHKNPLY